MKKRKSPRSSEEIRLLREQTPPLCKCGCSQPVKWDKYKKRWATYIKGHSARIQKRSAEICKKLSIAARKRFENPEERRKQRHNYKGGVSFNYNPPELTGKYLQSIRRRDNFECQLCGYTNRGKKRKLETHHIDDDRHNNHPDNIITLCRSCHWDTKKAGDKEAWQRVCTNLIKRIKRQNPQGHRDCVRIYKENMKLFYKK
ncbi:MAG: HNH endonuclease [Phycisphaerae bacterium]